MDSFKLPRQGIAGRLESAQVLRAITGRPHPAIETAVIEWSEDRSVLVEWMIVREQADVNLAPGWLVPRDPF